MPISEAVSDTGPLISFEKLTNGFSRLRLLFTRIYIPQAVLAELEAGLADRNYLQRHGIGDLISVVPGRHAWSHEDAARLDIGERAAIGLAIHKQLPLLIEERLGRRLASEQGLTVIGAAGMVVQCVQRDLLPVAEAEELLHQLYGAGRISRKLMEKVLSNLA